jgi:Ca-activated chloride channel family protein
MAWGAGCASDDAGGTLENGAANNGGGSGVGQSGAQDFGRFRSLVEAGEIPAPTTLDAVGFFNEHKFELPEPTCGDNVCVHGAFGVQGNMINGSNCTTLAVGFNTELTPDDFDRPPLNMSIAIDTSGSMDGAPINAVRNGLLLMADELDEKDEISLITYSGEAKEVLRSTPEDDPQREQLKQAIRNLDANGSTNIYEGLKLAGQRILDNAGDGTQNRMILLSDGVATEGITNRDRIVNLGLSYAEESIGVTTIGVGDNFDLRLMRQLSETGSGNFYFVEDLNAVEEIFTEEVKTFLVPLAEDISINYDGSDAYQFRAAYGTRIWEGEPQRASIYIPSLFLASRQSIDDIDPGGGRRGGGGIILLELVPTTDETILDNTPAGSKVGDINFSYRIPGTEEFVDQTITINNPLAPGETPDAGEFESPTVEKAFVTLNIYAGFRMATERAASGSAGAALNVLRPLAENVEGWLQENPDEDIQADYELMLLLIDNIEETGAEEEVGAPPNPWPQD